MSMTVSPKSAKRCCKGCDKDYGHSFDPKGKDKLRRTIKRRERRAWKSENH